ncbi:MAG: hypothetical protein ACYCT9_01300 [Leptospirillum sp.]|jgi:hypothetical protein
MLSNPLETDIFIPYEWYWINRLFVHENDEWVLSQEIPKRLLIVPNGLFLYAPYYWAFAGTTLIGMRRSFGVSHHDVPILKGFFENGKRCFPIDRV